MPGGDLMDVLVAEAKVIRQRVPSAAWQVACLAPKVRLSAQVRGVHAVVCPGMLPGTPCLQVAKFDLVFSGWQQTLAWLSMVLHATCPANASLHTRLDAGCMI
jgi:hypothetical protein